MLTNTYFEEKLTKNRNDRMITLFVISNSQKTMSADLQLYDAYSRKVTNRIPLSEQEMFELLIVLNAYFEA